MSRRKVSNATLLPRHQSDGRVSMNGRNGDAKVCCDEKIHSKTARSVTLLRQCSRALSSTLMIICFFLSSLMLVASRKSSILSSFGHQSRYNFSQPRIVQVNIDLDDLSSPDHISDYFENHPSKKIHVHKSALAAQNLQKNSKKYDKWARDPLWEGDCQPMQPWQETSFPSCNKFHEMRVESQFKFIASGGYNTVFQLTDIDEKKYAVKILEYETDHTDRNFDRVRRDATIMERASGSPYVVDIFSFCGFAQVTEFGKDGSLDKIMRNHYESLASSQKLQIGTQVAEALSDVHNLDGDGISSISHGDFADKQYILIDGHFKLNDFNRGRFIRWNPKKEESCKYTIGNNDGKFRAPEEYNYVPESAAIDVWALGSIFVQLLTGYDAWHGVSIPDAQKRIGAGELPGILSKFRKSQDPVEITLLKAIDKCYVFDPEKRPRAYVVANYLKEEAKKLNIDWASPFE